MFLPQLGLGCEFILLPPIGSHLFIGSMSFLIGLDVTDDSSVAAAVSATQEIITSDNKQLWCVVNNAATLVFADAEWQSIEMARKQLEVNTLGPLAVNYTCSNFKIQRTS